LFSKKRITNEERQVRGFKREKKRESGALRVIGSKALVWATVVVIGKEVGACQPRGK
jgi:hypothetical protein